MPFGPIGFPGPREVKVVEDPVEREMVAVVRDFREDPIGLMALMTRLEEIKRAARNPAELERWHRSCGRPSNKGFGSAGSAKGYFQGRPPGIASGDPAA